MYVCQSVRQLVNRSVGQPDSRAFNQPVQCFDSILKAIAIQTMHAKLFAPARAPLTMAMKFLQLSTVQ